MCPNGPGPSGSFHASESRALLPSVVNVGSPVFGSTSHGARAARFLTSSSQFATVPPLNVFSQHHSLRMSVLGTFHGSCASCAGSGVDGNTLHSGGYGTGFALATVFCTTTPW